MSLKIKFNKKSKKKAGFGTNSNSGWYDSFKDSLQAYKNPQDFYGLGNKGLTNMGGQGNAAIQNANPQTNNPSLFQNTQATNQNMMNQQYPFYGPYMPGPAEETFARQSITSQPQTQQPIQDQTAQKRKQRVSRNVAAYPSQGITGNFVPGLRNVRNPTQSMNQEISRRRRVGGEIASDYWTNQSEFDNKFSSAEGQQLRNMATKLTGVQVGYAAGPEGEFYNIPSMGFHGSKAKLKKFLRDKYYSPNNNAQQSNNSQPQKPNNSPQQNVENTAVQKQTTTGNSLSAKEPLTQAQANIGGNYESRMPITTGTPNYDYFRSAPAPDSPSRWSWDWWTTGWPFS